MHAYPEALAHVERALELWPQVPDAAERTGLDHVTLLREAARQADLSGSVDRALQFVRHAWDEVDPDQDPEAAALVKERWGRYSWVVGRTKEEGIDHVRDALRLLSDEPRGWGQGWRAIAALDNLPHLEKVRVPALCIAGELDKSSPPAIVQAIAGAIPGAAFRVLPGAPHMLFIEQPDAVAGEIDSFLRGLAA